MQEHEGRKARGREKNPTLKPFSQYIIQNAFTFSLCKGIPRQRQLHGSKQGRDGVRLR